MFPIRLLVILAALTLVACEAGSPPATQVKGSATASTLTNGMEFSGERACVDCDGIEALLRLEQVGTTQRYRMVEVYYSHDHERRFEDTGEWSTQGDLLRLRSSNGGERVYARLDEGVLQARGTHGQRIPAIEDDLLAPASFDSTH